ncbi:hypothetical protein, conserved [Eimeria tenella]|uniref:Uncharacterized protein n=1 Tax=Eimeria tenella TaxID=5802 RepID=U6KII7_EIMTE|nr:hypothetical protein, conserved [Eimeria tenella]CDJ37754.1 hypothetical protein, conserved [Eimeria tenella]|eukprot:XP_013228592.1 hypothetical protein, conserved [Eimeria tenella]
MMDRPVWSTDKAIREVMNNFKTYFCKENKCLKETQDRLDNFCKDALRFLCPSNDKSCSGGPVARKDVGTLTQQTQMWRCYSPFALSGDFSSTCIWGCLPHEVACQSGVKGRISDEHWSLTSPLESIIRHARAEAYKAGEKYVLQNLLDNACKEALASKCPPEKDSCKGGAVARKDLPSPQATTKAWSCYHPKAIINTTFTALCISDCGEDVQCLHGTNPAKGMVWTSEVDLEKLISDNVHQTCYGTDPPGASNALQRELDKYCRELLSDRCTGDFCMGGAVARKDVGDSSQREKQWRCYSPSQLTTLEDTALCVNECGEEISCKQGVSMGVSSLHWTEPAILSLIEEKKKKDCNVAA